jgi:uncharacterized protein
MSIVSDVLRNNHVFAVVGVSQDKEKYGCEVFETLLAKGYQAYAVNPKYDTVDGRPCYPTIEALPEKPEVVVTVVPPAVTEQVVASSGRLGVKAMWMPPGSWSDQVVDQAEAQGMEVIHDICMVSALRSLN